MQFEVTFGDTTYDLNDGNPFKVVSLENASSAEVARLGQRSPLQHGLADMGFRLRPRILVLTLQFHATTDAALDAHRQTLTGLFRPTPEDYPLTLRVERDDGSARTLACFATGAVEIDLIPEHRPGHYHRATIELRAADPAWKAASSTTATFTSGTAYDWWLAGGQIGTANVMEHTEWPTQGQAWTYNGTITGEWSVVFRSAQETGSGTKTAFRVGTANNNADPKFWWRTNSWSFDTATSGLTDLPSGTQNYMVVKLNTNHDYRLYYGGTSTFLTYFFTDYNIDSSPRAWRAAPGSAAATRWESEMPKVAVYNIGLSQAQRIALDAHMAGSAILGTITAVNSGDLPEYPYITLRGPLVGPILTNTATGDVLDLRGLEIGSADICYVDLTDGNKRVLDASGNSIMGSVADPLTLASWHLAPAPTASGGTNSIRVQGGSVATTTEISLLYHNRYMSF